MVDYRINLAKSLTSSKEKRTRFYHGMLIYLTLCAGVMVGVAYLSSLNLRSFMENRRKREQVLVSASAKSGFGAVAFKNPSQAYSALNTYSSEISTLKTLLEQRVKLLSIIDCLFADLQEGTALQSLSASKEKMAFGLILPPASEEHGDPVRKLKEAWEGNKELMNRVATIRPLTVERRTLASKPVYYVKFECILKK